MEPNYKKNSAANTQLRQAVNRGFSFIISLFFLWFLIQTDYL